MCRRAGEFGRLLTDKMKMPLQGRIVETGHVLSIKTSRMPMLDGCRDTMHCV